MKIRYQDDDVLEVVSQPTLYWVFSGLMVLMGMACPLYAWYERHRLEFVDFIGLGAFASMGFLLASLANATITRFDKQTQTLTQRHWGLWLDYETKRPLTAIRQVAIDNVRRRDLYYTVFLTLTNGETLPLSSYAGPWLRIYVEMVHLITGFLNGSPVEVEEAQEA